MESRVIGYAINSDLPLGAYSTFGGQSVGFNDILIRYTKMGDADLDGSVTAGDYGILDANLGSGSGSPLAPAITALPIRRAIQLLPEGSA